MLFDLLSSFLASPESPLLGFACRGGGGAAGAAEAAAPAAHHAVDPAHGRATPEHADAHGTLAERQKGQHDQGVSC